MFSRTGTLYMYVHTRYKVHSSTRCVPVRAVLRSLVYCATASDESLPERVGGGAEENAHRGSC